MAKRRVSQIVRETCRLDNILVYREYCGQCGLLDYQFLREAAAHLSYLKRMSEPIVEHIS
jgi:hypothetical protein